MAWTEELPDGTYRACWRDASGVKKRRTINHKTRRRFKLEKEARIYAIGEEAKDRDDGPQNDGTGLTWGQWSEKWLELRRVEPSTRRTDLGGMEKYLTPKWAKRKLRRITRTEVQAWINSVADESDLSATSVRRIFYLFSASMKAAVKAGHLQVSPCQLIDLPTPAPGKEHFLTKPEFWLLRDHLAEVNHTYADAAVILAFTGMRFGELAGLHWDRVDLDAGTIRIVETWDATADQVKAYPKSGKARTVPIPPEVTKVLMSLEAGKGKCGNPHAKDSRCTSPLVLTDRRGLPLSSTTVMHAMKTAAEDASLSHTRNHDLRHSYASWLAQDGVPLHVIQQLLGHGHVTTTERYSHIGAEQYERVLLALSH